MVIFLKPRRRSHPAGHIDIASEELPGSGIFAESPRKAGKLRDGGRDRAGFELDENEGGGAGTGSAPGEGPNPTA